MALFEEEVHNYASTSFPEPRPFQVETHEKIRKGFGEGHRCQLIMAPTGSGKTYIGLRIISEALRKGKKAIFVCDRRSLIEQTSAVADSYGLSKHSIFMANHYRYYPNAPFQIASAQTLARRTWPEADVIVVDEAHTQMKVWTDYIQTTSAAVIGLSATPFSKGLGKLFTNLVCATPMSELVESGVLVPLHVLSCTPTDMHGAATSGGEWTDNAAAERGLEIIGDVVSEWIKFSENRKTIVFGPTIAYCEELCRRFNACGITAMVFCATTTDEERAEILAEYKKPDSVIRILISVEALAKGMDQKDVSCIVDCRPLRKSLSTFIQMIGRGLRSSPETDKKDCLLLDHSGNINRFKDDFEDIYFNGLSELDCGEKLDATVRPEEEEEEYGKGCPACGHNPFHKHCMQCGYVKPPPPALIETVSGKMEEFVICGNKKMAEDHHHLYEQLVTYARGSSKPENQAGRAAHLYKDIMGIWPPKSFSFEKAANVPLTKNVLNKIKSLQIAYRHRRVS